MARVDENKELIINFQDADSRVEDLSKNLLALFVEVDHELVDVLVYAVREHFAVIPYKAHRNIKLTLRNILRHETIGDAKLRMSLFDNFDGSLQQTLFLDGREKFRIEADGSKDTANVKLVYEWRDQDPDADQEVFDEYRYAIQQARATHLETEDRMREVEYTFAHLARNSVEQILIRQVNVDDFKEVTDKQHEKSKTILEEVKIFASKEGEQLRVDTDDINSKIRQLEIELRSLEDSINKEQLSSKDIENSISTHQPVRIDPNAKRDIDSRYNKKEEVAKTTREISEKTLANVNKAKEDNLLWGLEQTTSKLALFDDITHAQGKAKDGKHSLEGVKAEVRKAQVDLARKEFELAELEHESEKLGLLDRELGMRIREGEEALQAMLADRKDAADRGNELELRAKEYESLLAELEAEVNSLKASSEGQGDSAKDMFKNSGQNNPDIQRLQIELDQAERERDVALNRLEAMDGAWVESVEEVSKEAERLAADSGDDKFSKDVSKLLKDIYDASNRSANMYQTLETTDQQINLYKTVDENQLAREFAIDVKDRNTRLEKEDKVVVDRINEGVTALEAKIQEVENEQSRIPALHARLEELLRERDDLQNLYDELLARKDQRIKDDDERERKYQRDLAEYNRKIEEINREIKKVKGQIDEVTTTIRNLQPQISELDDELHTWYEKIRIKREIIRKKKEDDELEDEYVPIPNDPIDIKIGQYKSNKVTKLPIKRIEEGHYMFATMRAEIKFDAKQPSNYQVLIPRTGKKFDLDDFIRNEARKELDKLEKMHEDHHLIVDESEKTELRKSPAAGRGSQGSPSRGTTSSEVVTTEKIAKYNR
jgi:hypothetical protein